MSEPSEIDRRHFLLAAAAATCACALSCPLARTARAGEDGDDDDDEPTKGPPPVPIGKNDVGTLANYAKDGVYDKWADSRHFLVVREGKLLFALSSVCSHKAGLLKVDAKGVIQCSKHHSIFTHDGQPTKGPATKSGPLTRHGIALDAKNRVIVDTSDRYLEDDWKKPGAFIALK